MSTATRTLRRYDHRLKELVRSTGDIHLAVDCGVPRSTAYGWLTRPHAEVVSIEVCDKDVAELQRKVLLLRRHNARLVAVLRLVVTVVKAMGFPMAYVRLTEKNKRIRILRAIEQARVHFDLRTVLRVIDLRHDDEH